MSDRAWKAFERRIAKDVGVQRIPVTGERHGADVEDSMFCYQAKLRRCIPKFLFEWLAGIRGVASTRQKVGVLVLKVPGMEDRDALVVLTWADWVDLHGSVKFEHITHRAGVRDQQRRARERRAGNEATTA